MAFDANAECKKASMELAREVSKNVGSAIHWAPDGNYREGSYANIYNFGLRDRTKPLKLRGTFSQACG